jgi:hypothetical protein
MSTETVADYLARLSPPDRKLVERARLLVAEACPKAEESIKWNAPNFAVCGVDRVTLGLNPKGGLRFVLHRGAKGRDARRFSFDDPAKLAKWPRPDRGVVEVRDLIGRWTEVTVGA